ncbi:hypothetical protein LMG33818_000814 [Halomonadaceae bacterium LMG 33818]|uniref:hypothetical protein n=1 Tax=Cernens ardua TaxID=3402176 RepID=UPI003EDBC944
MNNKLIYQSSVDEIKNACKRFLSKEIDGHHLQFILSNSAHSIVAIEEADIREKVLGYDGDIEEIYLFDNGEEEYKSAAILVNELLTWIEEREKAGNTYGSE